MNKILEYQKLDAELIALEKQVENSKESEALNKVGAIYKELQAQLLQIEKEAGNLKEEYDKAFKSYEENLNSVKKLTNSKIENLDNTKLNSYLDEANKLSSELFMLERKLNQILVSISNALKDFETTKNKGLAAKNKYSEIKKLIEKQQQEILPKQEKIKEQLQKMEAGLDKDLFAKYKVLKHDNVFPVFVPLHVNRCGYCRVELPSAIINSLKNNNYITCEHCRRLIYCDKQ